MLRSAVGVKEENHAIVLSEGSDGSRLGRRWYWFGQHERTAQGDAAQHEDDSVAKHVVGAIQMIQGPRSQGYIAGLESDDVTVSIRVLR